MATKTDDGDTTTVMSDSDGNSKAVEQLMRSFLRLARNWESACITTEEVLQQLLDEIRSTVRLYLNLAALFLVASIALMAYWWLGSPTGDSWNFWIVSGALFLMAVVCFLIASEKSGKAWRINRDEVERARTTRWDASNKVEELTPPKQETARE